MTTDERLDALAVTVENIAGIVKDMLEKQDAAEAQAEKDRQETRAGLDRLAASVETLAHIAARHDGELNVLRTAVETLVKVGAQHDGELNVLRAAVETLVKVGAQHDERLIVLTDAVENVLDVQLRQRDEIDRLTAVQAKTSAEIDKLAAENRKLAAEQRKQTIEVNSRMIVLAESLTNVLDLAERTLGQSDRQGVRLSAVEKRVDALENPDAA